MSCVSYQGDGWRCTPAGDEAIGPPFTLSATVMASSPRALGVGSAPIVTFSDRLAPFTRATAYGLWLQPQGALDFVSIVDGVPSVMRSYDVRWVPGTWFTVVITVSQTTLVVYAARGPGAANVTSFSLPQPLPNKRFAVAYVGTAPDPAYPRGFDAYVSSVGVINYEAPQVINCSAKSTKLAHRTIQTFIWSFFPSRLWRRTSSWVWSLDCAEATHRWPRTRLRSLLLRHRRRRRETS